MQTPAEIQEFLVSTLVKACKVDPTHVTPATHIFSDLGVDSADMLNVAWLIEQHYGIQLPVVDWMSDVNLGETVAPDHFRVDNFVAAIAELTQAKAAVGMA